MRSVLRVVEQVEHLFVVVARWFACLAACGVAALMALLVTSTLQRYVLLRPIPVTEELGALLFLGLGFLSLPYGFVLNRHVRLALFWRNLPKPQKQISEILGYVLGLIGLFILIRVTYQLGQYSLRLMERTDVTGLILWPWRILIPLCLTLLAVLIVFRGLIVGLKLLLGEDPPQADTRF